MENLLGNKLDGEDGKEKLSLSTYTALSASTDHHTAALVLECHVALVHAYQPPRGIDPYMVIAHALLPYCLCLVPYVNYV